MRFLAACFLVSLLIGIHNSLAATPSLPCPPPKWDVTPKKLTIRGADCKEMVLVSSGYFYMGSESGGRYGDKHETPVHRVWVDDFYMDTHEVTVGEYKRFLKTTPTRNLPELVAKYAPTDSHPVVGIKWEEAAAYCAWAGELLPSEAQWEKAARGETGFKYPWGNASVKIGEWYLVVVKVLPILSLKDEARANYCDYNCQTSWRSLTVNDGYTYTAPVGTYEEGKSPYGIYDLAGNVWEWARDWYDPEFYKRSPERNPVNTERKLSRPITGRVGDIVYDSVHVARGGSWRDDESVLRAAYRRVITSAELERVLNRVGFRCVIETSGP